MHLDPTTCGNWLKYGGAPFSCDDLEEPDPRLDISDLSETLKELAKVRSP